MSLREDPTLWAAKRKAAAERAKQLREERKRGVTEDSDTFTPQINRRPSYLNSAATNKAGDSLDMLAGQRDPNDPMEQPLAANRAEQPQSHQHQQQQQTPQYQISGTSYRGAPSPGSDALGNEMKKFPPKSQQQQSPPIRPLKDGPSSNRGNSSSYSSQYEESTVDTYVPYERQSGGGGVGKNNASYNAAKEADDIFASNLRSDGNSKPASGRGWNDDVTTTGAFEIPKGPGGIAGRHAVPKRRPSGEVSADIPTSSHPRQQVPPRRTGNPLPDWNSNTEFYGDESMPSASTMKKLTPRSPRLDNGMGTDVTPPKMSKEVSQVKSRLSLLKSKMRRSESSGGVRNSSGGPGHDEGVDVDENSSSGYSSNAPKSAPQGARLRTSFAGVGNKGAGVDEISPRGAVSMSMSNGSGGYGQRRNDSRHNRESDSAAGEGGYGGPMSMNGSGIRAMPRQVNGAAAASAAAARRRTDEGSQSQSQSQYDQGDSSASAPPRQQKIPPRNKVAASRAYQDEDENNGEYHISSPSRGPVGSSSSSNSSHAAYAPFGSSSAGPDMDPYGGDPNDVGEQIPCPDCGRKFNPGPYERHVKICAKVFMQKRKAFDSTKMRIQAVAQDNPELVQILSKKQKEEKAAAAKEARRGGGGAGGGGGGGTSGGNDRAPARAAAAAPREEEAVGGALPKWKQQSKMFRESMRAARQVTVALESGAPLPPPVKSAIDPSLVLCPHCGRRFNEKAADRHIPQCQNIRAKPTMLKRGVGGGGGVNGAIAAKQASKGGKFH